MTNAIIPENAVLSMEITITRAATGKQEKYTLIGTPIDEIQSEVKENEDGRNAPDSNS